MPTPTPSHRLTLLRKFEKQVAPLERYGVDFLGLCEDTRAEILHLERRGKVDRKKGKGVGEREGNRGTEREEEREGEGFAKFRAGVGDSTAIERGAGAEESRASQSFDGGGGDGGSYEGARKQLRRAKTLYHPKDNQSRSSKWYGFLGRRSQHTTRSTSPALGPIRTLSPRPVARASLSPSPTGMIPNDGPRRRLSKVHRTSKKGERGGGVEVPQIHPNYNGSGESLPNPSSHGIRAHQNTAYTHPDHGSEARTTMVSPHVVFEDGVRRGGWREGGVEFGERGHGEGDEGDDGRGGGNGGNGSESESDSDGSVITYNDGTEKGRAKRIRMLERWNRAREARQRGD
ncbi:MAG: hypothetical protein L6R42_003958 [Xanthoria sp. 1 TBL-2021]|nr:MAG: hypothetical protein L6R42_003958 [Xanthoria sp. 1 TBL-2021]